MRLFFEVQGGTVGTDDFSSVGQDLMSHSAGEPQTHRSAGQLLICVENQSELTQRYVYLSPTSISFLGT
jgi:hypothetical protein